MILVVDNYDSFTYNLVQLLLELGAEVQVVRNDVETVDEVLDREPRAIVLSPGPVDRRARGSASISCVASRDCPCWECVSDIRPSPMLSVA